MRWNRDIEVLVVGAGPVGMLTALLLREQGVEVRVIDEQWRTAARSYALAIHPSSLELFDDLGMAPELVAAGRRVTSFGLYDRDGRRAEVDLSVLSKRFPFVLVLPQNVVEEAIETRLSERGVEVDWNHRLQQLDARSIRPTARVERVGEESSGDEFGRTASVVREVVSVDAAFVVGADGHRSKVRTELGVGFDAIGEPESFAVFEFSTSSEAPREVRLVLADERASVCWPMPGGRVRWSFQIAGPEPYQRKRAKSRLFADVGQQRFPQLDDEMLWELARDRAPWHECAADEVLWSIAVLFERRLASRFGEGAVWLAGDASHVARPAGVHSMNVGFLEARELAGRLTSVLKKGESKEQLGQYAEQRRAVWKRLLADDAVRAGPGANEWVARHAGRIHHGIPASGAHLDAALAQLGLAWGGA